MRATTSDGVRIRFGILVAVLIIGFSIGICVGSILGFRIVSLIGLYFCYQDG